MLLVALALMAQAAVTQSTALRSTMPSVGQPSDHCPRPDLRVSGQPPAAELRKLNEMPDAEPQYAVIREIDGCPIPVKVNAPRPRRR